MLGRQFDLVVTEEDLSAIEAVLRARGDVQFLSSSTNEGRNALLPLKSLRLADAPAGPLKRLCYLAPEWQNLTIEIEPLSDVKVQVGTESSEVIEFWRSYCSGGEIQADRVYYTPRYFVDGEFHQKNPNFVRWAARVVRAIKGVLTYDKVRMAQIGPVAAAKIASGELRLIG